MAFAACLNEKHEFVNDIYHAAKNAKLTNGIFKEFKNI
jgi:hypothetical protein